MADASLNLMEVRKVQEADRRSDLHPVPYAFSRSGGEKLKIPA